MPRSRSSRLLVSLVAVAVLASAPASASAAPFNGGGNTASALVFFPNPVVTSGNLGLTDQKDADYPALNDERVTVLLTTRVTSMLEQLSFELAHRSFRCRSRSFIRPSKCRHLRI